jgi:hypothetical protein
MHMTKYITLRTLIFLVGALGAVAEAVELAQKANLQVTPTHLIALSCTALLAFALKWPGDVTAKQADEREERARRASEYPPPSDMTAQRFTDLVRDIHLGKVELRDEDKP